MYILKAGVTRHMKVKLDNSLYAVTDIGRTIVHLTALKVFLFLQTTTTSFVAVHEIYTNSRYF